MSVEAPQRREHVRVTGTVQGVGFRPYVYRLAAELGLGGWVLNDSQGVLAEVEGPGGAVDVFLRRLPVESPPLAVIERVEASPVPVTGDASTFAIRPSPQGGDRDAPVSADSATCDECLRELDDPGNRRHRYPFINCTNCGPRFTIVRDVPYDRPLTTMSGFRMCPACQAEYDDPGDRRFHAQPNACPVCGPSVSLVAADGSAVERRGGRDPLAAAAAAIRAGAIVAIKGLGGYHLACRADDERVVARLRARKHREDKPFALMVRSVEVAARLVELSAEDAELLSSPARPIVLAPRRVSGAVADAVAPRAGELGVMLAYAPLHHLLLSDLAVDGVDTVVMTSGNVSDEPIAYEDEDARERLLLGNIAELLLTHDRPIETRTDDSVARVIRLGGGPAPLGAAPASGGAAPASGGAARARPMLIRRSRGYVPASIALRTPAAQPILACGAEQKNTFCLASGPRAWVSHHIGDLENYETLRSFTVGIEHFERLFDVSPAVIAHDLHREYLSTKYAVERGLELIGVQHHHAHLAACLAEHGETGPAVGAIFDGTGLGLDGGIWGGELLLGDLAGFSRVGSLRSVPLPGGAAAIREPWRMACAWLCSLDSDLDSALGSNSGESPAVIPPIPHALRDQVAPRRWELVAQLARSGVGSPQTSSIGRLFDAVAAICGVAAVVNYEGQAAIELEACSARSDHGRYEITVTPGADGLLSLDPRPGLLELVRDLERGATAAVAGARFHAGLAAATVKACAEAAWRAGVDLIVLSGGVFQNRRLTESVVPGIEAAGLRVLLPQLLPPGDGGISYGQAAVAAELIARGHSGGLAQTGGHAP